MLRKPLPKESRQEPEDKNAKGKTNSENFAAEKMFGSQKISQQIEDVTFTGLLDFRVFLDILEIFAEDCFLLRSFRKFLPSRFSPLSRFQESMQCCPDDPLGSWARRQHTSTLDSPIQSLKFRL